MNNRWQVTPAVSVGDRAFGGMIGTRWMQAAEAKQKAIEASGRPKLTDDFDR